MEVNFLTSGLQPGYLKSMWCIAFAALAAWPLAAAAQAASIPGRDLLAYPIALTAEAPALGTQTGTGLWNPATALLPEGNRWRLGVAAMSAPSDYGISAQVGTIAFDWRRTTLGLTIARAAVGDLSRTDTDPQSIGSDIPYTTTIVSVMAARRLSPHLVAGLALRSRNGRLDNVNRTGASLDAGLLAEHLAVADLRLGASTFLWNPGNADRERASYSIGADFRLAGGDTARTVRAGYALQSTTGLSSEQFAFASGRWGRWEARGGPVRTEIYGGTNTRFRLGITVRHAGYAVGVAREESAGEFAPTYHFSLGSMFK